MSLLHKVKKVTMPGAWLLLCTSIAMALRGLPYRNFTGPAGEYLFYGPDSYDHLRRITLGMATFPHVPTFDAYMGYPVGTGQIWSPLFDYLLSALMLLLGADVDYLHTFAFWLPPVLGAFTVILVYRVGTQLSGSRVAGAASALIVAILPGHILYSFVSELDHHVLEPLICLTIVGAVLQGSRTARAWNWVGTALLLVVGLLLWRGTIVFWGLAFAALGAQLCMTGIHGRKTGKLNTYIAGFSLGAALLLAVVVGSDVLKTPEGVHFGTISWFHVWILLGFAAASAMLHIFFRYPVFRGRLMFTLLILAVTLAAVPPVWHFLSELASGLSVIGGYDPWLNSISELRPMLYPAGKLNFDHATETLSALYWLTPLAAGFAFWRWWRDGCVDFGALLLGVTITLLAALPLFRERYVHLAALAVALSGGLLLAWAVEQVPSRKRLVHSLCVLALGLALLPTFTFLKQIPHMGLPLHERMDLPLTLNWMRAQTPRTSHFNQPLEKPEYGVLANWGLGAHIVYRAQRPSVATNFGWETHGLYETSAFLTHTSPSAAERILADNGVRYLLLEDESRTLGSLRDIAVHGASRVEDPDAAPDTDFDPRLSMYHRLYLHNGSAYWVGQQSTFVPALGRYRLIYQSPNGSTYTGIGKVSHYKVFEVVPGALIKGEAPPGSTVTIRLDLYRGGLRATTFQNRFKTHADGSYSVRVPFPTDQTSGIFTPANAYSIRIGNQRFALRIPATVVYQGTTVQVGRYK